MYYVFLIRFKRCHNEKAEHGQENDVATISIYPKKAEKMALWLY